MGHESKCGGGWALPLALGPIYLGYMSLFRNPIGPKSHWFEIPLVRNPIGPKSHWSENEIKELNIIFFSDIKSFSNQKDYL